MNNMDNIQKLVVCIGEGGQKETAEALAKCIAAPLSDKPGEQLTLMVDSSGVSLTGFGLSYRGDFEQMLHRITKGRLHHEMLIHAAKTKDTDPRAIDATAGMGEDALLLAAFGYEVTLFEQNAVIAALLRDAMERAEKHPILGEIVGRMHLIEGNSVEYLSGCTEKPDLIYLDPMFPARQKSGLINKKLQLIQKLENPCMEEALLLEAAIKAEPKKIIIKRPLKGACLAGKEPSYTIKGKAIRYDCFAFPKG